MSATFTRFYFLVLSSCVLLGCGGGDSDPALTTDTQSESTAEAPSAPSAGGGTPTATASRGPRIDSSTPDGTVKEALAAVQDNEFERVWDLLPKNYQTDVNDLFKEFGNQVDAEMWNKSFNMVNRFLSVMITKKDMLLKVPEAEESLKSYVSQSGSRDTAWVTEENLQSVSEPVAKIFTTFLNSDLTNSKKLKSFDGRVFCAKTLDPLGQSLQDFGFQTLAQIEKKGGLPEGKDMPAFLTLVQEWKKLSDNVQTKTESIEGDHAVVSIQSAQGSAAEEMDFIRVDGKWIPEEMGLIPEQIQTVRTMIPMIAGMINAQKPKVMPVLAQIEPLIEALQKAKTQEEFNTAFTNLNTQAPQLIASAMGIPGLSSKFGGGSIKVSPATIKLQVTGPMTDKQLSEIINKLEALTDDPERAITFPTDTSAETPTTVASSNILTAETINALQITPVSDPQIFADAIKAAEVVNPDDVQFDPQTKIITLSLKFEAPQPAETPEPEK